MHLPPNHLLIKHATIDSTNLEAKRLIQAAQMGDGVTIITAKSQTAGRGRLERSWVSKEGNLFVSFVVNRESFMVNSNYSNSISSLPFLSALAIGKTISEFINERPLYKWPNDVLLCDKKISGVLIETLAEYAIIGIGVNIAHYPEDGTKLPATCLKSHTDKKIKVEDVLERLINNLDQKFSMDMESIREEWTENAYGVNKKALVNQGKKKISGVFRGIDENGGLILETKEGKREAVLFGDISWI